MIRVKHPQDFWAGVMFTVIGCLALWFGRNYVFGTATKMGPGWFPTVLSWALIGLGLFLSGRALAVDGARITPGQFRPQFFILLSIIVFAQTIERFGLAPAVILTAVVASFARREFRPFETLLIAALMAIACVVIFIYGVGQPMSIWSWNF